MRTSPAPSSAGPSGFGSAQSRRELFRAVGLIGAAALAAARPRAARAAPPDVSADVDPNSLLYRLVQRITFGYSDAEYAAAGALGYSAYLEQQLNPDTITEDPALVSSLASLTTLTMTLPQLYATTAQTIVNELIEAKIRRAVSSKKQLLERMVDFWTDHFNIDINIEEEQIIKTVDDRSVIRPNALGTFPALLSASTQSPAMLYYLNNDISTAAAPNENYARELMELHTLSPAAGYSQNDVHEVARCLTGWGRYSGNTANGGNAGLFRYIGSQHDNGSKTLSPVFDLVTNFTNPVVIPANQPAMSDGLFVINILIRHPSTANFIAGKLCKRLLGENVPSGIISSVAQVYLSTGGDIKAMLRAVFSANLLADAQPRFKRPFHLIASALRALPTTITSTSSLRTQLTNLGHFPFSWSPPDGYPDTTDYWSGLELPRWNFGASVATSGVSGVAINNTGTGGFLTGLTTGAAIMDKINRSMFGGEMSAADRSRLQLFLPASGTISNTQKNDVLGLAIGSPGFQWY